MTRVVDKGEAYYKSTYYNLTKTNIYVYASSVLANNSKKHKYIRIGIQLNPIKERQTYTYICSKTINIRICA